MKNTWYVVIFGIAVILLVLSRPTIDDYLEGLDNNWYVAPIFTSTADQANDQAPTEEDEATSTGELVGTGDTTGTGQDDQQDNMTGSDAEGTGGDVEVNAEGDVETTTTLNGYVEYEPAALDSALAANKDVALFFHADRCPSCQALEADIEENNGETADNQVIFKVNYDTATELKQQYEVTSQHTIVYLDNEGNATNVNQTALTLEELVDNF